MIRGEKAKFTFQPEFAYGDNGQPPTIPAKAVLIFEIELLSWVAKDDLFGDDGCIKSTITEGKSTFEHPKKGTEVCISTKVTDSSGNVIEDKSNFDYVLGSGELGPLTKIAERALEDMG